MLTTDPSDAGKTFAESNKVVNATRFNVHGTEATPQINDERARRYFKDENGNNVALSGTIYVGARLKYTAPEDGLFTYTQTFNPVGPFQFQVCSSTGTLMTELRTLSGNSGLYCVVPSPTEANPKRTTTQSVGFSVTEGEWIEVGFLVDTIAKNYDLYINGDLKKQDLVFAHKDGFYPVDKGAGDENYYVGGLKFGSLRNEGTSNWYIDDVIVREVAIPYEIEIEGPSKITDYIAGASNTYTYTASVLTASGTVIPSEEVTLSPCRRCT